MWNFLDDISYYWKVKNRGVNIVNKDGSREPRGEITLNHTLKQPESSAYNGIHFVECYAIQNYKCIAFSRVYVNINK